MMMVAFLQDVFTRFSGNFVVWQKQAESDSPDRGLLDRAVEHVVDETSRRLRAMTGYRRRLEGPVADTFRYIDELVERMPDSFLCSRSSFSTDPRVKAFFVSPRHMQEVFSQSRDVRELFDTHPEAEQCCGLVCMRMEERQKFGVALVGDSLHREVMQTTVSFGQHQVYSPGVDEADARRALKCCIFNSLLTYIRQRHVEARASNLERKRELITLRNQLRQAAQQGATRTRQTELQRQIEVLENTSGEGQGRPSTLEDDLVLVTEVLRNPSRFVSAGFQRLRLTHMGVKVGQESRLPAYELDVATIRVAAREPRVAALVRFPRSELLPKAEFQLHTGTLFPA